MRAVVDSVVEFRLFFHKKYFAVKNNDNYNYSFKTISHKNSSLKCMSSERLV